MIRVNNMNEKQVIKALECCIEGECGKCPNKDELGSGEIVCVSRLLPKALTQIKLLVNRWNKLKKWLNKKIETCPNYEWYDFEEVMCEIQDLEKEFDVR